MVLECLTRRHTPYGLLSDTACNWIESNQILRWTGENWVYLKRKVTAGLNRFDVKGRRLPVKESECCYDSMLLDFAIKRLQETPSMEDLSESETVEHIIAHNICLSDYKSDFEDKYHISKLKINDIEL